MYGDIELEPALPLAISINISDLLVVSACMVSMVSEGETTRKHENIGAWWLKTI